MIPLVGRTSVRRRLPRARRLPLGAVLYHGPSMLGGGWIVVIVTGFRDPSDNVKTGRMYQIWVLAASQCPTNAVKTGADAAICGDCEFRHAIGGACYVVEAQAPQQVWLAWQRGRYADWTPGNGGVPTWAHDLLRRPLRATAYGDPAAAPRAALEPMLRLTGGTAYSHQWDLDSAQWLKAYAMASVSTVHDAELARSLGWRTFRVGWSQVPGETWCPADRGLATCETCGLCAGQRNGDIPSIWNPPHGSWIGAF